ncbi:Protein of unknown function DUF688 protein [Actinidia chinensis var. chinensis]|uniref:Uncharacterized protein n=1 Tax=Actinidia chinensis var. chinensis TaxID=1590841 RepID=A0A2R6R8F8_ACTCC|nr:Protein of unknown function DUF688 protein [Actinidia chinensis var. chinensis]
MGDQEGRAIDTTCPRKLDYNAPLLSTRRPSGATNLQLSRTSSKGIWHDSSERIPFSWEQTSGKPKNLETMDTHDKVLPPLKLPPGRLHRLKETFKVNNSDGFRNDNGCDVNVEDDDDDDAFSDAIDMFSLSGSIDLVENFNPVDWLGGVNSEIEHSSAQSPSFLIQRFLPDATAIAAASSGLAISENLNKKIPQRSNYHEGLCVSSPKGCGFDMFFPWRVKHKPCGVKSPVRQASLNAKTPKQKR